MRRIADAGTKPQKLTLRMRNALSGTRGLAATGGRRCTIRKNSREPDIRRRHSRYSLADRTIFDAAHSITNDSVTCVFNGFQSNLYGVEVKGRRDGRAKI